MPWAIGGGCVAIGVVGPYGFAAGGCETACGAYGEATA